MLCQAGLGCHVLEHIEEQLQLQAHVVLHMLHEPKIKNYLEYFVSQWEKFNNALLQLNGLLLYFKNYPHMFYMRTVQEIGETIFCDTVLEDTFVEENIKKMFLHAISDPIQWDQLRIVAKLFESLEKGRFYNAYVEAPYLEHLEQIYTHEGEKQRRENSVNDFLTWVSIATANEESRAARLLCSSSAQKTEITMYRILVSANQDYIIQSSTGFTLMFNEWNFPLMRQVINIYCRIGNMKPVLDTCTAETKKICKEIFSSSTEYLVSPVAVIRQLLTLLSNIKELSTLFEGNLGKDVILAVQDILNSTNSFVKMLALYFDYHIRSAKGEVLEKLCQDIIYLFRLINDKDIFEISFRNYLAGRLLHAHSKPELIENETYFITAMKQECDTDTVSRMEKMINDIKCSSDTQNRLMRAMEKSQCTLPLYFKVTILTGGFWPQYSNIAMPLPEPMNICMEAFKKFYDLRHSGRKITFPLSLGTVVFQLKNLGKTYSVTAPTPFVNTIESLNTNGSIFIDQICNQTSFSKADIDTQLMALEKVGFVTRSSTTFEFNQQFSSQRQKIRIVLGAQKDADSSNVHGIAKKTAECSRSMSIDAVIVRILKRQKMVEHEFLCQEVTTSLSNVFTPTVSDIKSRISLLIEKGFLKRGDQAGIYIFVE
ncbi:unnamed protein product [Phytomonas sp. Hart1]|nr:unnamed protein product [Phytomonas sp. Hart1]|eukprot:CCW66871.1 unnamed protein product [Phytomonas sp. isolate Hart1]